MEWSLAVLWQPSPSLRDDFRIDPVVFSGLRAVLSFSEYWDSSQSQEPPILLQELLTSPLRAA